MYGGLRRSVLVTVASICVAILPAGIALADLPNGLTTSQQAQLRKLSFAVLPDPLPAGFHITKVSTNLSSRSYEVDYLRSSDGATLRFAGSAGKNAPSGAPPPQKHGFFQQIASTFGKVGNLSNKSSAQHETNTDPATEQYNGTVADSSLIGPIKFTANGHCLQGVPDKSKAKIQGATFAVDGCNLSQADPLVRAYKSLAKP
jgi:hypothetical protein